MLGRSTASCVQQLQKIAAVYEPTADREPPIVPDFHTVRQALNVASADQRILVLVHGTAEDTRPVRESLRDVASDDRIIGRFHFDFDTTDDWKANITELREESGITLIRPDEFGMSGTVMRQLPLNTGRSKVVQSLIHANSEFARTSQKKDYSTHVTKGRSMGIYFEGGVPYGEDRDGDGQIDRSGRTSGRSRSRNRNTSGRQQR